MKLENTFCYICKQPIASDSGWDGGYPLNTCPNDRSLNYRTLRTIDFNDKDPQYACSLDCRAKAILSGVIPMKEMLKNIVPSRFLSDKFCLLENWKNSEQHSKYEHVTKWLNGDSKYKKGWVFAGTVGRGKTCLAIATAYELRKQQDAVKYIQCVDLNDQCAALDAARDKKSFTFEESMVKFEKQFFRTSSWSNSSMYSSKDDNLEYDCYVFDDFSYIDFTSRTFMDLFNKLYDEGARIIITSNLAPEDWAKRGMDARLISRLKGECNTLSFIGEDFRSMELK